ncbi:MAG: response regulator [Caldilineae bacterium]|nr:MAG: response regulator [Caldilineae bacterium]
MDNDGQKPSDGQKTMDEIQRPILLVIDDDPLQLRLYKVLLAKHYSVMTAARSVDAINILEDLKQKHELDHIQAILLDIMMPNVDGFKLLQHLRQEYPQAPVIMCSAMNQREHVLRAMNLGASDYLLKPFRRQTLLEKLAQVKRPAPQPEPSPVMIEARVETPQMAVAAT